MAWEFSTQLFIQRESRRRRRSKTKWKEFLSDEMCRAFVATDNTSEIHSQPSVKYAKREKRNRKTLIEHFHFSFLHFSAFYQSRNASEKGTRFSFSWTQPSNFLSPGSRLQPNSPLGINNLQQMFAAEMIATMYYSSLTRLVRVLQLSYRMWAIICFELECQAFLYNFIRKGRFRESQHALGGDFHHNLSSTSVRVFFDLW